MTPPRYVEYDSDEPDDSGHAGCHLCSESELHRKLHAQRERAIEALIDRDADEEDMHAIAAIVRVFNHDIALIEARAASDSLH